MVPEFSGESSVDGLSSCGQEPTSRILERWCVRAGKRVRKSLGSCKGPSVSPDLGRVGGQVLTMTTSAARRRFPNLVLANFRALNKEKSGSTSSL